MHQIHRYTYLAVFLCVVFAPFRGEAQSSFEDGFSGQFFLTYEYDLDSFGDPVNEFSIKRGYITFRRSIADRTAIRFTQDISIDGEGDGAGDIELRLKYALVNHRLRDRGFLTEPQVEVGVVRRPWIDFEQKINDYRSQKEMFLDQNGILSSADYGVTIQSNLGDAAPREWARRGIRSPGGRYGSASIGLYNGGGYSALERNTNKVVEGRITLRPFPDRAPGLQASWLISHGKGNTPENPDFRTAAAALSYESMRLMIFAQLLDGIGDGSGILTHPVTGASDRLSGWSAFAEVVPVASLDRLRLTLRHETLRNESQDRDQASLLMAGIAYLFTNRSKVILDVSRRDAWQGQGLETIDQLEVVLEIRF